MAQNWRDKYPKIAPSPAALPLPGGVMPGAGMGIPPLPPQAFGAMSPSFGAPDSFSYPGGGFMGDKLLDRAPLKAPLAADHGAGAAGPTPAVQWAIDAIRNGADPKAVRARLQQMDDKDFPSSFAEIDLNGREAPRAMSDAVGPMPPDMLSVTQNRLGVGGGVNPASNVQNHFGDFGHPSNPGVAPDKDAASKYYQSKGADPLTDRAAALGRGIVDDVTSLLSLHDGPATNLTPWQLRRRRENEAIVTHPRIRAFLDAIAFAEGRTNYDSLYGNHHQTFTNRATHPGNVGQNGGGAAGRYQILPGTYRDLNNRLGPYSMSDRDQDLMAVELMRERGALDLIESGNPADFDEAVSRLGRHKIWASFPVLEGGVWHGNPSGQRTEDIRNIRARFDESLAANRPRAGITASGSGIISH